jgi:murein DD-endopeptidase MepM/ murein hydrolase activator NlpD
MATFPLPQRPTQSYKIGGVRFGDDRGSVLHAACDLIAVAGTEVYAVEDGEVIYGSQRFFESGPHEKDANNNYVCKAGATCLWVHDLLVKHKDFLVRYGEIAIKPVDGIKVGTQVKEGQLIAHVGAQSIASMLHFEMYSNPNDISYPTVMNNMQYLEFPKPAKTYHRRKDLRDPTGYLDTCAVKP